MDAIHFWLDEYVVLSEVRMHSSSESEVVIDIFRKACSQKPRGARLLLWIDYFCQLLSRVVCKVFDSWYHNQIAYTALLLLNKQ